MSAQTRYIKRYTENKTRSHQLTYESAGEDLIVSGAQLSPQMVSGDSTGSGCFLSVVHLSIKEDIHSLHYQIHLHYIQM